MVSSAVCSYDFGQDKPCSKLRRGKARSLWSLGRDSASNISDDRALEEFTAGEEATEMMFLRFSAASC